MIQPNQTITYPGATAWQNWQPESEVLHAFAVGILVTILTYQAISIIFDISLGLKRRGTARVTDVSSLLLSEESSLSAVVSTLFPNSRIASWRHHGFQSECPRRSTPKKPIRMSVLFKFLLLLGTAPFVNLVAIILSLERDTVVSFRSADFGGLVLGANFNLDVSHRDGEHNPCRQHKTNYGRLEFKDAEFFTCLIASGGPRQPKTLAGGVGGIIRLSQNVDYKNAPPESFIAEFESPSFVYRTVMHTDLFADKRSFRVKTSVSVEEGKQILRKGVSALYKKYACPPEEIEIKVLDVPSDPDKRGNQWTLLTETYCKEYQRDPSSLGFTMRQLTAPIALIDDDQFQLLEVSNGSTKYVVGDDLPFLRRRRSFVPFVSLCIAVLILVILRAVVMVATNNDVHKGVEIILKQNLLVKSCDSMLQDDRKVYYTDFLEVFEIDPFQMKKFKQNGIDDSYSM